MTRAARALGLALFFSLAASAAGPECDEQCLEARGMPVPTHRAAPKYPEAAAARHVEGCVVASFEITPQGLADKYQVLDSQPKGVFDGAALKALNDWRFKFPEKKPGRYAERFEFRMSQPKARKPLPCMAAPGYDALNAPAAPPAPSRELHLLQGSLPPLPPGVSAACVTVKLLIKHDGFVGDVQVLEARPAEMAAPTAEAAKQWWFDSFPPPDLVATKTLTIVAGEQVKLPDAVVRGGLGTVTGNGQLANQGCGTGESKS